MFELADCSAFVFLFAEVLDDAEVFEGGDVAFDLVGSGKFAKQAAHDFAAAGFRQTFGPADFVRLSNSADLLGDVLAERVAQFGVAFVAVFQRHECDEGVALDFVRTADDGGFGDSLV